MWDHSDLAGKYETGATLQICGDPATMDMILLLGYEHTLTLATLWFLMDRTAPSMCGWPRAKEKKVCTSNDL